MKNLPKRVALGLVFASLGPVSGGTPPATAADCAVLPFRPEAVTDRSDPTTRALNVWSVLGPVNPHGDPMAWQMSVNDADLFPEIGMNVSGRTWRYFDDRLISRNLDDYADLFSFFAVNDPQEVLAGRVAYLGQWIWSPDERTVTCQFGFNDQAKVLLNGRALSTSPAGRLAERADHRIPCGLEAGWNRLVVKVANPYGAWGGYFSLKAIGSGSAWDLALSPTRPGGALKVETQALPKAWYDQPYVELALLSVPGDPVVAPVNFPSASALELSASGGRPPYRWTVEGLPAGLSYDGAGRIRGRPTTASAAPYPVRVRVLDADGASDSRTLQLTVVEARHPGKWLGESSRIGGLSHRDDAWSRTRPYDFAEVVGVLGYSWVAPTDAGSFGLENGRVVFGGLSNEAVRLEALRARGIRLGTYLSVFDVCQKMLGGQKCAFGTVDSRVDPVRAQEHNFEAIVASVKRYKPAVLWLDEYAHWKGFTPYGRVNFQLDAVYSAVKALSPETLVLANGAEQADYLGDADMVSMEGLSEPGEDRIFGRWPQAASRVHNPKYLVVDSFRYPGDGPYASGGRTVDWTEWLEMMLRMLSETANFTQMRSVNLDSTITDKNIDLYMKLANWMAGRKSYLKGLFGTDNFSYSTRTYDFYDPTNGHFLLAAFEPARDIVVNGSKGMTPGGLPTARLLPDGQTVPVYRGGDGNIVLALSRLPQDAKGAEPRLVDLNP